MSVHNSIAAAQRQAAVCRRVHFDHWWPPVRPDSLLVEVAADLGHELIEKQVRPWRIVACAQRWQEVNRGLDFVDLSILLVRSIYAAELMDGMVQNVVVVARPPTVAIRISR